MSYTALYRKFRPDHFKDVKGQEHIVTTLKNQIELNRIGHAYLFCGTRGTGKTSIAKLFAKTVNCEEPIDGNPCGECKSCRAIQAGASMNVIEIDAASNNGVDNIREIVEEVSYSPAEGKYKVYIIDEVHMLSIGAFNALLKTLEEPPSYVIFILATTEVHKIPITILSRCQRYDFKRITIDTIADRLSELVAKENVEVEEKAIRYIAKTADGSMRDALSLLDQAIAFHFGEVLTYEKVLNVLGAVDTAVFSNLLSNIISKNVLGCMEVIEEIVMQGRELNQFTNDFLWYLRNLLLVKTSQGGEGISVDEIIDTTKENLDKLTQEAQELSYDTIMRYLRIFSELSGQLRYATQKRILLETNLIKLCKPSMEKNNESLLERIKEIETKLEQGVYSTVTIPANGEQLVNDVSQKERKQVVLEKAVPEDVQEMVKRWKEIVGKIERPAGLYLKNAGLSLGGDNKLMIVVEGMMASDYFLKNPENIKRLEGTLSDIMQKEISVTIKGLEEGERFQDNYIDLTQVIAMDIEIED